MAVTSTRPTYESWFSNPSKPVSRNVICAEMTNPEISAVFQCSIQLRNVRSDLSKVNKVSFIVI